MTEPSSAENESTFPGRPAVFGLGVGLLVGLLVVLAVTMRDNGRRTTLETIAEFTAVGDTHYFPMPETAPSPPYQPVARLHGKPLYPVDFRKHEATPDDMTRAGVDETAGYLIYQAPVHAKDEDIRKLGNIYYLKISPTEFLKTIEGH